MDARDEAYEIICKQIQEMLGKDASELAETTSFEGDLGFTSVNYVLLSSALEDEFEVEVAYMDLKRSGTLGGAADFMAEAIEG